MLVLLIVFVGWALASHFAFQWRYEKARRLQTEQDLEDWMCRYHCLASGLPHDVKRVVL